MAAWIQLVLLYHQFNHKSEPEPARKLTAPHTMISPTAQRNFKIRLNDKYKLKGNHDLPVLHSD